MFHKKRKSLKRLSLPSCPTVPPSSLLFLICLIRSHNIPSFLLLTQTLPRYRFPGKQQSKACFPSLPFSRKLHMEARHLFTCVQRNVVFFMATNKTSIPYSLSSKQDWSPSRSVRSVKAKSALMHMNKRSLSDIKKRNMYTAWTRTPSWSLDLLEPSSQSVTFSRINTGSWCIKATALQVYPCSKTVNSACLSKSKPRDICSMNVNSAVGPNIIQVEPCRCFE